MNIKNSVFILTGNKFINNFADQLDVDFSTGKILDNIFMLKYEKEADILTSNLSNNGDGVDLSGSKVLVMNNTFDGFLDKAVSVGEKTTAFINENNFQNNRSAVTIKDQSSVFLGSNNYNNNVLNIEAYQKKKIFKDPKIFILNETHDSKKRSNTSGIFFKTDSKAINFENSITNVSDIFKSLFLLNWTTSEEL